MSAILSWFGIGKQERMSNIKSANDEITRLRSMLANIPSTGITHEEFLNTKEAYNLLKTQNEKLIAMNQELIADVHLASEANKTEMTNLKSSLEIEKQNLRNAQNELTEEKVKLEISINKRAAELLSSIGCPVSQLPSFLTEQDFNNKSAYTIRTLQQQ